MSSDTPSTPRPSPDRPALSPHEIRELSVRAKVHPNTLIRYLRGAPVRSTVHARITEALRQLGPDGTALAAEHPHAITRS